MRRQSGPPTGITAPPAAIRFIENTLDRVDIAAMQTRVQEERRQTPDPTAISLWLQQNAAITAAGLGQVRVTPATETNPPPPRFGLEADVADVFLVQVQLSLALTTAADALPERSTQVDFILAITRLSSQANRQLNQAGQALRRAYLAANQAHHPDLPQPGAAAAVNLLATYLIGQRVGHYLNTPKADLPDWETLLNAISPDTAQTIQDWLHLAAGSVSQHIDAPLKATASLTIRPSTDLFSWQIDHTRKGLP